MPVCIWVYKQVPRLIPKILHVQWCSIAPPALRHLLHLYNWTFMYPIVFYMSDRQVHLYNYMYKYLKHLMHSTAINSSMPSILVHSIALNTPHWLSHWGTNMLCMFNYVWCTWLHQAATPSSHCLNCIFGINETAIWQGIPRGFRLVEQLFGWKWAIS